MAIKLKDKKIMDHLVMEDLKVLGELLWAFLGQSIINDFYRIIMKKIDIFSLFNY